jgi:hypothetical protein
MAAPVHTKFAMAAIDFANIFKTVVGTDPLPATEGAVFQIELSAPEGPSTGGGTQSLQHVRLVREGMTVVAGSIDSVQHGAELRSFAYANSLHAQRFKGSSLPIAPAAYEAMLKRVKDFIALQGYTIVLKDAAPLPVAAKPASGGSAIVILLVLLVTIAAAAGAYFYLLRR